MDVKTYSQAVAKMPLYDDVVYGLITEVGEVTDILKKGHRPGRQIDLIHLKEEIGDVFWYLTRLSIDYGFDVEEILSDNVAKLEERHNAKFLTE